LDKLKFNIVEAAVDVGKLKIDLIKAAIDMHQSGFHSCYATRYCLVGLNFCIFELL